MFVLYLLLLLFCFACQCIDFFGCRELASINDLTNRIFLLFLTLVLFGLFFRKESCKNTKEKFTRKLHLRLFSVLSQEHQSWATAQCDVSINSTKIQLDRKNNRTGVKERGYHIVKPLDITSYASQTMDFEITSNNTFAGVAVIEIVREFSVSEIGSRVEARCKTVDSTDKHCAICNETESLLRCSRCKSVWYCGTKHQAKDWPFHQTICTPAENRPKLKTTEYKNSDDDVVCGETRVSLKDPLMLFRIKTPVRGSNCPHPQCVDLHSFLRFSHQTGNWQCPVCTQPLKYEDLVIDDKMKDILDKTAEDIDQVRLYPNGEFKAITLEGMSRIYYVLYIMYIISVLLRHLCYFIFFRTKSRRW